MTFMIRQDLLPSSLLRVRDREILWRDGRLIHLRGIEKPRHRQVHPHVFLSPELRRMEEARALEEPNVSQHGLSDIELTLLADVQR